MKRTIWASDQQLQSECGDLNARIYGYLLIFRSSSNIQIESFICTATALVYKTIVSHQNLNLLI